MNKPTAMKAEPWNGAYPRAAADDNNHETDSISGKYFDSRMVKEKPLQATRMLAETRRLY